MAVSSFLHEGVCKRSTEARALLIDGRNQILVLAVMMFLLAASVSWQVIWFGVPMMLYAEHLHLISYRVDDGQAQ